MAGKKKGNRTRAQHYVPQFYLRGFASPSEKLFCFDKAAGRMYLTNVHAAAQESNFYEIPPTKAGQVTPDNLVEKALGGVETAWAPLFAEFISSADAGGFTDRQVTEFGPFLATQWLRTKTYRDFAYEAIQKGMQTIVDDLMRLNFPDAKNNPRFCLNPNSMPAIQADQLFDQATVEKMADCLDRNYWVVGLTDDAHPLYTSDHPVVRRANRYEAWRPMVGARDPGVEYAFPLDTRHLLLVLERKHFSHWRPHNNRSVRLTPKQIADYNGLQVRRSCQRVYCLKDDFDLAREVCAAEPEVCDPNRPRVRAGSTPMVDHGDQKKNYTYVIALE